MGLIINPFFVAPAGPVLPITANLASWWRADSYVGVSDGFDGIGTVGYEWVDQSGGGHTASIPSVGITFKTNIVGTKPILRFFDNNKLALTQMTFAGDFTAIVALSIVDGKDTLVLNDDTANLQLRRNRAGSNVASYDQGTGEIISSAFGIASSSFGVNTWRRTGTTVSFRENTTSRGTGTNAATMKINGFINNVFLGSGNVDLGEIILYSGFISDSDMDNLMYPYLKDRWTTLP